MKKFLESSCSLPDFVERYRSLYLRLKNAMEELFGQQTAFVLALRHGFSAALLQLSILRAMHVRQLQLWFSLCTTSKYIQHVIVLKTVNVSVCRPP